MFGSEALYSEKEDWKAGFLAFVSVSLEELFNRFCMDKLSDITSTIINHKADILGQMVLAFIRKRDGAFMEQEQCHCPECGRVLKKRELSRPGMENTKKGGSQEGRFLGISG
jgi:hypothetical protein